MDDSFWFTKKEIAVLLGCSTDTISHHLEDIFITKELDRSSVVKETLIFANDKKIYKTKLYN